MIKENHFEINCKLQKFIIINAENQSLGKLATLLSSFIAKNSRQLYNKNNYFICIRNFAKLRITGSYDKKKYYNHTDRIGTLKRSNLLNLLKNNPALILENTLNRMTNKSHINNNFFKKIHFLL